MKFRTRVNKETGQLTFKSDYHKALFIEKLSGKEVTIEDNTAYSLSQVAFYKGVVRSYIFYQHAIGTWNNLDDCGKQLELWFNKGYFTNESGGREEYPKSISKLNKTKFNAFLERIDRWCTQNGYLYPCSKEYEEWLNNLPIGDTSEFPPLQDLKDGYLLTVKEQCPWR